MSAVGASQFELGAQPLRAPPSSDEALVAEVRRGDDRAFEELYSRYGARIVSYVLGMVGDHGRAEDIAQEVFISALRRMRATERPIAFKPWVFEIAKNACIDEFRRTKRAKEVPLEADDDDGERQTRVFVSGGPTPDTALERRQQLDDLRGAFRGLSDNHHKILVLRELEGLSYTEIGRRMGMTPPVVESTLFRARKRLGQEYEEIASGQRCEHIHAVIDAGGPDAVRALGIREHRRLARHVAHCQPCRRYAWSAGVDESILKRPSIAEKVAALLPIPAFLRWRRRGRNSDAATGSGSHSFASLQTASAVNHLAAPGSPWAGLGRVAAAVAAVAVAGGGVVVGISSTQGSKPQQHRVTSAATSAGGSETASAHHSAPASPVSQARRPHVASKSAATRAPSTHSSNAGTGSSSPPSSAPASSSSASPAASTASSAAGSSTSTGNSSTSKAATVAGLLSSVSSASAPKPTLPPVSLPSPPSSTVSSTVNTLKTTVGSTVNNTLSTLKNTLGGL